MTEREDFLRFGRKEQGHKIDDGGARGRRFTLPSRLLPLMRLFETVPGKGYPLGNVYCIVSFSIRKPDGKDGKPRGRKLTGKGERK